MDLATGHVAALNKLEKQHLGIKVNVCSDSFYPCPNKDDFFIIFFKLGQWGQLHL